MKSTLWTNFKILNSKNDSYASLIVKIGILATAYAFLGWIGLRMAIPPGHATAIWLPSGLALALILIWGRKIWPGVWVGSAIANSIVTVQATSFTHLETAILLIAGIATGSTLQAVVGSYLVRRLTCNQNPLSRISYLFRATVFGVIPSCFIASTIGVGLLCLSDTCTFETAIQNWYTWFSGDFVGILIFTPFILSWCTLPKWSEVSGSFLEAIILSIATFLVSALLFGGWPTFFEGHFPATIAVFPLILWSAIRFGQYGLTMLMLVLSQLAVLGTVQGRGYFSYGGYNTSLIFLDWFFGVATMTGLSLVAAFAERRDALAEVKRLLQEKSQHLESAEARLKVLVSNAPVVLFALDSNGTIILSEGKGLELLGLQPGERVGTSVFEIYKNVPDALASVRRALKGEAFSNTLTLNSTGLTMQVSWVPLRDALGNLVGTIGVSIDVTSLTKSEKQRQILLEETQRQAKHLRIVNNASAIFANASLNYQPLLDTITRTVAETFGHGCAIRLKSTLTGELEFSSSYFLDSETTTEALVVPMRVHDRMIGTLSISFRDLNHQISVDEKSILQDIADRAGQAVENARLYEEAQKAVRLREEFVSVASHELRTPITTLKMQVYLFRKMLESGTVTVPSKVGLDKLLLDADEQVVRLEKLIADLLDVSRLNTGRLALNKEVVDLVELVKSTIRRIEPEIKASKCELKVLAKEHSLGRWDKYRIEQVLTNLITNAIKFGREKPIEIEIVPGPVSTQLSVSDQGIGVSKRDQNRIFERFERAVSERSFGGLGLGLYVTSQIVQQHGGRISIESEPGAGARFIVELPNGQI